LVINRPPPVLVKEEAEGDLEEKEFVVEIIRCPGGIKGSRSGEWISTDKLRVNKALD